MTEVKVENQIKPEKSVFDPSKTVGPNTNDEESATSPRNAGNANTDISMDTEPDVRTYDQPEAAKEQGDDGGEEMVEGEEDTVIY